MGNTCGKNGGNAAKPLSGKEAYDQGFGSPGIVCNSRAAHDMSEAWSTGYGRDIVSHNQSVGARYANSLNI